jgi:hypothetical protein
MIYIPVTTTNSSTATRMRTKAMRCGIGRVVVANSHTTILGLGKAHTGVWLDRFLKDFKATRQGRISAPLSTKSVPCGLEILRKERVALHTARCLRCKKMALPTDVRADTQAQVSEEAAIGNARNSMAEVRVGDETAVSTHDELGTRLETIETNAMSLAANAEAARQTLLKLGEMEAELATLQRSYTEALATAGTLLAGGLNGS